MDRKRDRFDSFCAELLDHARNRRGVDEISFGEQDMFLFLQKRRIVCAQFCADNAPVANGILGFTRDEMQQRARALHMAQKFDAQTFSRRCALDDAGNVRENQFVIHAQPRLQGGKRVIGDFLLGAGQLVDETGFSGVGKADKADIGDELELQPHVPSLSRRPATGTRRTGVGG